MAFASSTPQYNYFKEKRILQEEEKSLKEMLHKFQDQLNRLKIEELALVSMIKMKAETGEASSSETGQNRKLEVDGQSLETISDTASMSSSVIPVGLMYEDASGINRETLDLKVENEDYDHMNDFEEEEEDEDDEEEEMEDFDGAGGDSYTSQLRSYMDSAGV